MATKKPKTISKTMAKKIMRNGNLTRRFLLSIPFLPMLRWSLITLPLIVTASMATELIKVTEVKTELGYNVASNAAGLPSKLDNFSQQTKLRLPPDFLTALQAVLVHHPALKGQQAELKAFESGIDSAKGRRYPTFSAQANNLNDDDQGTLRLNQPLWAFGKIDTAIDEATAKYTAEHWRLLQTQRQLISDTANIYAKIQGIELRIIVAQQNISEHKSLHGRIFRRQEGQLASDADARLAYSRLLQARSKLQRILGEKLIAQAELQALTQVRVDTKGAIGNDLLALPARSVVSKLVIANNAEIRYKREQVKVVSLNLKQEKVASLPTISLRVEYDLFDNNTINNTNVDQTRVGLVFESNMEGLGLVTLGRVNAAAARINVADEEVNAVVNDIKRQVNVLMINRDVQHELIRSQKITVEAVEATMASFIRQYNSGRKSWVEVLNNQRELTELRLQLVEIATYWQQLSLQLLTLMGTLDDPAGLNR